MMKKEVIAFFKKNPQSALKAKILAEKLGVSDDYEYHALKAALHQLVEEKVLERRGKRFMPFSPSTHAAIVGRLEMTMNGYGFVQPDKRKSSDIFISEHHLNTAMHGDQVEVVLFANQSKTAKNLQGEIVAVLKRKWQTVSGFLKKSGSVFYVVPDIPQLKRNIIIDPEHLSEAKPGDRVLVKNIEWYSLEQSPEGQVEAVLRNEGTFDDEYAGIIAEFNLRNSFSAAVMRETTSINETMSPEIITPRTDFRDDTVFTIDPVDAKDFDDALSIKKLENGNLVVGIHIADVSHYVLERGALDKEARERGNSVYLPGKVIPMLPERLSNGLCSLKPDVERLTFSVVVEISQRGKLVNYSFHHSVIKSKRRYTYEEVQQIIETQSGDYAEEVLELHRLSQILRKKRLREGSINFITPEVRMVFGEGTVPVDIVRQASDDSHNLVEEFMLVANRIVATHVKSIERQRKIPFVYRVHDQPDPEKLKDFIDLLKSLGHKKLPSAGAIRAQDFNAIIESVAGTPEEILINQLAIRTMAKAVYSADNIGHYGLGFKYYTHFTSPIRRYSDLLVHRALWQVLTNPAKHLYSKSEMEAMCEHISQTERNAVDAERMAVKLKQIQFLASRVGDEFDAVISGVTNFGLFVEIVDYLSEGLVHIRTLDEDYFIFDEKKKSLIGRRTGIVYRLGDPVRVKLITLNVEKLAIDFVLVSARVDKPAA